MMHTAFALSSAAGLVMRILQFTALPGSYSGDSHFSRIDTRGNVFP
jgi:hypothetical protein